MSEERLQEIKDSIDLQYKVLEIAKAENAKVFVDEEKELYDEVLRLNNIINELEKWLYERSEYTNFGVIIDKLQELKGVDKE